jgi:hypothetical protein
VVEPTVLEALGLIPSTTQKNETKQKNTHLKSYLKLSKVLRKLEEHKLLFSCCLLQDKNSSDSGPVRDPPGSPASAEGCGQYSSSHEGSSDCCYQEPPSVF